MANTKGRGFWINITIPATLFAVPFTIYFLTLAPTITWRNDGADSGELVTAAYLLGIPHPPGYPLYVLLAKLFTLLPIGDAAYRVNLMSAFFASATVTLLYLASLRLLGSCFGDRGRHLRGYLPLVSAAAAGLFFAFSPTFWSQATIAEVYSLNAFFVALIFFLLLSGRGDHGSGPHRLAFVYSLSLTNHLSMLLLAPVVLLSLTKGQAQPVAKLRHWGSVAGAFLLGLTPYALLPLRAAQHPALNWGDPHTWSGFLWVVSGQLYRGFVFALPWAAIPGRIAAWAQLLLQQFTWVGLFLGLVGLWVYWQINRIPAAASLLCFGAIAAYAMGYNTTDSYVYLIPSYLISALWLALGIYYLPGLAAEYLPLVVGRRPMQLGNCPNPQNVGHNTPAANQGSSVATALAVGLLLLPLVGPLRHYSSQDLSKDWAAYQYASEAFAVLAPESIVVSDTDPHTFALWYFTYVLKPKTDIVVVNRTLLQYEWYRQNLREVYPQITLPRENGCSKDLVRHFIEANIRHHPTYLTYMDPVALGEHGAIREGPLYRVVGDDVGPREPLNSL